MVKKPAVAVEHFKPFKPFPYMLSFLCPLTALFSLSEAGLLRVRVVVLVASLISYRKGSAVLRGGARCRQLPEVIIRRLGRVMDGGLRWTSYSPPPSSHWPLSYLVCLPPSLHIPSLHPRRSPRPSQNDLLASSPAQPFLSTASSYLPPKFSCAFATTCSFIPLHRLPVSDLPWFPHYWTY